MTRGLIILNEIAKLGWIAGRDLNNETSRSAEATSSALLIFYIFFLFLPSYSHRFTKIEVDPQVKTPDGKYYDVLFIGTGNLF